MHQRAGMPATVRAVNAARPPFGGTVAIRFTSAALCAALLIGPQPGLAASRSGSSQPATGVMVQAAASVGQLVGQKLVVAMHGTTPSSALLGRIQRGEIGGVILFGANIRNAPQLARLTRKLRAAAATGGQPPLLITTDQEGGLVKRVPWAPPTLSPPQMGSVGSSSTAFTQGKSSGHVLACAGINGNLAPVADVPRSTSSFMYQQGRTWSFDASVTALLSDAFASGTEAGAAVPAMKHFPGLGRATKDTDTNVVTISASASQLASGLRPYRKAIGHGIPMVMLSNATYPAYDRRHAAGWSHAIGTDLLRGQLGFSGVTITDSLNAAAATRGVSLSGLAVRAAAAGTDMILMSGSEASSAAVYQALVDAVNAGKVPMARLNASYQRITAMKSAFPASVADSTPPGVDSPASALFAGTTLGATTIAVSSSWAARDGCRISAFGVERKTGGTWAGVPLSPPWATEIVQGLHFGTRYRYSASATDGAGNVSDAAAGMAFRPLRLEEDDAAIRYHGGWHPIADSEASGDGLAYSRADGAKATFSFTGFSVSWVAVRGPSRGSAAVYVDGAYAGKVNLHAASRQERQVVFARSWAASGAHRLTVVNLGTADHSRIDVDAFLTLADG
jgi:beta-N-acetylhexosaminidase